MPLDGSSAKIIKQQMALARKRELAFGLCFGKKIENSVFITHTTKPAKALGKLAKTEGETPLFTFGRLTLKGKELSVAIDGKVLSGFARKAKKMFNIVGLKYNIIVLDPSGAVIESDVDEGEGDAASGSALGGGAGQSASAPSGGTAAEAPQSGGGAAGASAPAPDPLEEKWQKAAAKIKAVLTKLATTEGVDLSQANTLWKAIQDKAKSGDFKVALEGIAKMPEAMKKAAKDAAILAKRRKLLEAKWQQASEKLKPLVAEFQAKKTQHSQKIQAAWALMLSKVSATPPDFETALKAVGPLARAISEARQAAAAENQASGSTGSTSGVAADEASGPTGSASGATADEASGPTGSASGATADEASGPTGSASAVAADEASGPTGNASAVAADEASGPTGNASGATADEASGPTGSASAVAADEASGPTGSASAVAADEAAAPPPAAALPKVDLEQQITRMEATIKSLKDGPVASYNSMISEAVSATPNAWKTTLQEAAKLASDAKATPVPESAAKLDTGEKSLAGLKQTIATQTQIKTEFQKALTIFDLRMVPLTSHPKAAAPEIVPEIAKITGIRTAALAKSKNHALKTATDALSAAESMIAATEILADDFAHFVAADADRKPMAATDRGKVTGDPAIDGPARKVEVLYDTAQQDRAAKKFKDGIAKLDKIPPIFASTKNVKALKKKYDTDRPNAKTWVDSWAALPAATRALITAKLAEVTGYYTDSDIATTKDYAVSIRKLSLFWHGKEHIENETPTIQQYPPKLAAFETKLTGFKTHAGASGIQAMILKMETDLASAKSEAALYNFSTATSLLAGTSGDWPATLTQADNCKAYKETRVIVQGKIDALKSVPQAASLIEAAKALMAEAGMSALKFDFVTANTLLADAEKRADNAQDAADDSTAVDNLHDKSALDDLAANWQPAFDVYTNIRDEVVAADFGNNLTALTTKAQLPAADAEAAHTAHKHDEARTHLDSAISNLKAALILIHGHTAYSDIKTSLEAQVAALAPLNIDNCLQSHIDKVGVMIVDADNLIKPEAYNYTAAETKLADARKVLDLARADGALFTEIKVIRAKATAVITAITAKGGQVATQLAHRITDIQTLLDEGAALQTAGNFKAAAAKAQAAADWEEPTVEDIKTLDLAFSRELKYFSGTGNRSKLVGAGKEAGKHQIARADADFTRYESMKAAHTYSAAGIMLIKAIRKILACEALMTEADLYTPALTAAQAAVDLLAGERNAATADMLKEVDDKFKAAKLDTTKTDLTANNYSQATKALKLVTKLADALENKVKGATAYEAAQKPAKEALDEAQAHKQSDAIEAQLTRLTTKYANMLKLIPEDFATAKTMADEVAASAADAIKTADNHATLEAVNSAIGGDEDSAPWWPQVQAAKLSIRYVSKKEHADVAKVHLGVANAEIESCRQDGLSAKDAKAHLLAALEACNTADEVMSQYAFFVQAIAHARTALIPVSSHGETAFVTTDIAEIEKLLASAETTAKTGLNYDKVSADIEAAIALTKAALELANQHKEYTELRAKPEVEPRLAQLEAHEHRYAIKANIDTMRQKLVDATTQAEARKMPEAIKLLEEVRDIGTAAFVLAEMRANTPPTEKDIKEILSRPNGAEKLDEIIDSLGPEAQRAVVKVAFEARFGCTLENFSNKSMAAATLIADADKKAPNIVAFFKAMKDLPLDHTLENDSMSKFTVIDATGQGSFYRGSEKRVVMYEGDATTSSPYPFGSDDAVGSLDDTTTPEERAEIEKCKPTNEDPVTFFNWNTLHEVGHAVDDKNGFMDSNGKNIAFGGWTEYGGDVSVIAEKFATKFQYDKAYVSEYMAHNKSPYAPPKPSGEACTDEEWESRRIKVQAHIDAASKPASPWSSMAKAKKLAIGGIVYHENGTNTWVSYQLAARARGITAYQFRAPGEWFSELYAAYHSKKLKPNHPADSWLSRL